MKKSNVKRLACAFVCITLAISPETFGDEKIHANDSNPLDYVTLFPTWQRGFIVDARLIHAAGEDGILLAMFSSPLDRAVRNDVRTLLPLTQMVPATDLEKRYAPDRHWDPVFPALPPMLYQWDVLDGQILILYGGIKNDEEIERKHDFWARTYTIESIGGPVREVPRQTIRQSMAEGKAVNFGMRLGNLGQDDSRRTIPRFDNVYRPMHFSIRRVEAEGEFEIISHPLIDQHKRLFLSVPWCPSEEEPIEKLVRFFPEYQREAFLHIVVAGQYFLIRDSGPIGRLTHVHLTPRAISNDFDAEVLLYTQEGAFRRDKSTREWNPVAGDPLDPVADFSRIPEWSESDPSTHFMVQDRDAEMVRFFWGVSGYAEMEVLAEEPGAAAAAGGGDREGDREEKVRVRFERLPAPPEMEHVRSLLLNPPEFERPEVFYQPFEGDRARY